VPASTRRVVGALLAAVGIILAVVGSWIVVKVGPSGQAQFSAVSKAPGAVVVPSGVLNSVDVPVRVTATRPDGGAVRLSVAPSVDARALLGTSSVSTVSAVHFPAGTVDLRATGLGALGDISTADVWRLAASGAGSAQLVVDQARAPETAVVTSGDANPLTNVTVTLAWANRAWFFEALVAATLGAVIAVFALSDLWQSRAIAVHGEVVETTSGATI
jgi:uncharacterized membrane protein YeaQ/YmgE (transglycosylase-associated protein family)